jgi:hypothetical protein
LLAEVIGMRCPCDEFEDDFRLIGTVVFVILAASVLFVVVITRFGACFIVLVVELEFLLNNNKPVNIWNSYEI